MKRDPWTISFHAAMAQARHEADTALSTKRRQLDVALANPKAEMGDMLSSWVHWRTTAAMHKCIADMQANPADFLDAVQHSAAGRLSGWN